MSRVNYNPIAHQYDEPIRQHPLDQKLVEFLRDRPDLPPAEVRVLDVGCGTGAQLIANQPELGHLTMIGLDVHEEMVRQAQGKSQTIPWLVGNGAELPFPAESFDYITNQFSYHHMSHKQAFFQEVYRLLRPGGRFVLTNMDPWSMPRWLVYRYFPAALERDKQDFWPSVTFLQQFKEIGFKDVQIRRRVERPVENLAEFYQFALDRHRASQLMVLSEADYQAGLELIQQEIAHQEQLPTPEGKEKAPAGVQSEFCKITIEATKK